MTVTSNDVGAARNLTAKAKWIEKATIDGCCEGQLNWDGPFLPPLKNEWRMRECTQKKKNWHRFLSVKFDSYRSHQSWMLERCKKENGLWNQYFWGYVYQSYDTFARLTNCASRHSISQIKVVTDTVDWAERFGWWKNSSECIATSYNSDAPVPRSSVG